MKSQVKMWARRGEERLPQMPWGGGQARTPALSSLLKHPQSLSPCILSPCLRVWLLAGLGEMSVELMTGSCL